MFMGNYTHSMNEKGRVAIPAKFRSELGEKFVLSKGIQGCLFIFSMNEWECLAQSIRKLPMSEAMDLTRYFFGNAIELEPDSQGRIIIPQQYRKLAELTDRVEFYGTSTRIEVWNPDKLKTVNDNVSDDRIVELFGNMII